MRREIVIKGKGLAGSSDLTLLASIKPGFVPALDTVTYKSRVKRLLKALHLGRTSAHEYALTRPLSDAVERVGRIHSVRVLVIEEDDKVLLSASFDGSWESYFRVLWQKTGRLLDAIYCNTVDYTTAWDHSYEEWRDWARRVQLETDFYYALPSMTVDDQRYLKATERHARRHPPPPPRPAAPAAPADPSDAVDADLDNLRFVLPTPEEAAQRFVARGVDDDFADGVDASTGKAPRELVKQALQSLAGLYGLTDLYLPGTADGFHLERAAVEFLSDLRADFDNELDDPMVQRRFDRQVRWLRAARKQPAPAARAAPPALPTPPHPAPTFDTADVQGGIVQAYDGMTHGCLLLLAFDTPAAAAALLGRLLDGALITTTEVAAAQGVKRNIAFTLEGLRACGLDENRLALFPDEFRHGMAARAGQIGDLRTNHPRRWARPLRLGGAAGDIDDRIDLAAVHVVLQLRIQAEAVVDADADADADADIDVTQPGNPLHGELGMLVPAGCGTRIVAVESLRRQFSNNTVVEHFGYADASSGPTIDPQAADAGINQVLLGELLIGHDNEADHAIDPAADPERTAWLRNGSFLVVRKLRQDVGRFRSAVAAAAAANGIAADTVYGKLMGRKPDGTPMTDPPMRDNSFNYNLDPHGGECPLHAHIRLANPRNVIDDPLPGRRRARLARRSMSYGTAFDGGDPDAERGLMFMAYNASIGEQFEAVQRWLAGGNSTGSLSAVADPIVGVPESGRQRWFIFEHGGKPVRMPLDGSDALFDDPRPFVRVEWGAYLFTPSMRALRLLQTTAQAAARPAPVWSVADGERTVQALLALGSRDPSSAALRWKQALEDIEAVRTFGAASVWAAVRANHGGLLRTPYGVLVADAALVQQVLDDTQRFSVRGYLRRMHSSIGADHLGFDDTGPGCPYRTEADVIDTAIGRLDPDATFVLAREAARDRLALLIDDAKQRSRGFGDPRYELGLDPRELVDEMLAVLCETWFGIEAASGHFERGGQRWDWQPGEPPRYPGHFGAPSRYVFQPNPGEQVVAYGQAYGAAVRTAMRAFVNDYRAHGRRPQAPGGSAAPIGEAAFGPPHGQQVGADLVARRIVGALMGFVPTVDGALRRVTGEWTADGTLWSLRARQNNTPFADLTAARAALLRPMTVALQLRPMPELIWRTASAQQTLAATDGTPFLLQPGDTIVLALVSALQSRLLAGSDDLSLMFGGDRSQATHPTHACPGAAVGTAALLGVLAVLVEHPGGMRPGSAPPALTFEGDSGLPLPPTTTTTTLLREPAGLDLVAAVVETAVDSATAFALETGAPSTAAFATDTDFNHPLRSAAMNETTTDTANATTVDATAGDAAASATVATPAAATTAGRGVLMAWGDSWLSHRLALPLNPQSNLIKRLVNDGFTLAPQSPYAASGTTLATMAALPPNSAVYVMLNDLLAAGRAPRAVLLSASGNDCVKSALMAYVRDRSSATDIDAAAWQNHLDGLRSHFVAILTKFKAVADRHGARVPVVVHGYDHPIADGRYLFPWPGSAAWMHGWLVTTLHYSVPEATGIMRRLIDGLNGMMATLVGDAALGNVVHLRLAGTLRATIGGGVSDGDWFATGYRQAWENELHPTPAGFGELAAVVGAAIDALP